MPKFILGFPIGTTTVDPRELVVFDTKEEAEFDSEEWVEIEASSLEEAKERYEEDFLSWQRDEYKKYN